MINVNGFSSAAVSSDIYGVRTQISCDLRGECKFWLDPYARRLVYSETGVAIPRVPSWIYAFRCKSWGLNSPLLHLYYRVSLVQLVLLSDPGAVRIYESWKVFILGAFLPSFFFLVFFFFFKQTIKRGKQILSNERKRRFPHINILPVHFNTRGCFCDYVVIFRCHHIRTVLTLN